MGESVVIDGRRADLGEVTPNAALRISLTADSRERAKRRAFQVIQESGIENAYRSFFKNISADKIRERIASEGADSLTEEIIDATEISIKKRDEADARPSNGGATIEDKLVEIDTTHRSINETLDLLMTTCSKLQIKTEETISQTTHSAIDTIKAMEQRYTSGICDEAKLLTDTTIAALSFIAIGTDWIDGYRKEVSILHHQELNLLFISLRQFLGSRGIELIYGPSDTVSRRVGEIKTSTPNARGIVLGKDALINLVGEQYHDDKNILLATVDNKEIGDNAYSRVVELIYVSMLVFRKINSIDLNNDASASLALKSLNASIIKDHPNLGFDLFSRNRIYFMPKPTPIVLNDDELKSIYSIQRFA